MQKHVIFVKLNLKIDCLNNKNCRKVRDHCNYTEEYKDAAHSICNLM